MSSCFQHYPTCLLHDSNKAFRLLQSPQIFLQDASEDANDLPADNFASAGAVLEVSCGSRACNMPILPARPCIIF